MLVEVDGHRVAGFAQEAAVLAEEAAPQIPQVLACQRERRLMAQEPIGMHQAVGQPACLAVLFGGGRLRGGRPVLHRPERARPEVGDIALVYGQVDQTVHHGARLRGPLLARLPPCKHGHRRQRHAHGEGVQVLVPAGAGPDPVGNRDRLPGPAPQRQVEEPVRADASAQPRDPLRLDVHVLIAAADHAHERHGELELRLHVGIADAVAQQSRFDAEDAHEVDLTVGVGVGRLRERIDHLPRALGHVERVRHQRLVALAVVGRHRRGGRLGVDVRDRIARLPVRVQVVAGLAAGRHLVIAHRPANLIRRVGDVKTEVRVSCPRAAGDAFAL